VKTKLFFNDYFWQFQPLTDDEQEETSVSAAYKTSFNTKSEQMMNWLLKGILLQDSKIQSNQ